MSKARELANLGNAYSDGALSNRNLIINGAMQVAQRGTSFTSVPGSSYTLDRWRITNSGLSTYTQDVEQVSDAPSGFQYSWKTTTTTTQTLTGTNRASIATILEGQDITKLSFGAASARTITLSFWSKASVTGTYSVAIWNGDVTRSYVAGYTVSSANTWEYQTVTVEGDTGGTWPADNGRGMWISFNYGTGPDGYGTSSWVDGLVNAVSGQVNVTETLNATFQITGVQLEVGDTATPFEHRSYGQELALCQRYYYNTYDTPQSSGSGDGGLLSPCLNPNGNADRYSVAVIFPVQMRAKPTMVYYGGRGDTADTADRVAQYNGANLRSFTTEPDPTYKALRGWFDTNVSDNAISFHFTADAEL